MTKLNDLTPDELDRVKAAFAARDELHRSAIADLAAGSHGVEQIKTRLNYKRPKSVYNLCHRFEIDVGRRFEWPWRKRKHPGPKPAPLTAGSSASRN